MWVLLKPKTPLREGDEIKEGFPSARWTTDGVVAGLVLPETRLVRRELKGWEAVLYALETEVLGNDKEGCETTELFWDCECNPEDRVDAEMRYDHIHPKDHRFCPHCRADRAECADSRKAEVIMKIIMEGKEGE